MSDVPLYLRIRDDLKRQITSGALAPGTKLPSTRQLAADLRVSRITATNAYAELEAEGLIEPRTGSGTYVAACWPAQAQREDAPRREPPRWQGVLDAGVHPIRDAVLSEAARPVGAEDVISFARARGDARLFPVRLLRRMTADALSSDWPGALEYESSRGYGPLREVLSRYLRQQGIAATADDVLITSGAQQAIDLIARALIRPGDRVVVEAPAYPGALEAFEARGAELIGVPLDGDGMSAAGLERALGRRQPRLIYAVPTFHNPTGQVMSAARRREVVALAERFCVPVLEDEYLREVRFGSPVPPPLAAFDQHGNVIHVGSFSKSLAPSLRLGYVVAGQTPLRDTLDTLKRAADVCTSPLLQRVVCRLLESGVVYSHWKRVSRIYRRRQAAMAAALQRYFPAGTTWTSAAGGLVMWVGVPAAVSVTRLFEEARSQGVSFAAGAAFFPEPADQPFMRLNFAALDEAQIERGIAILGRLAAAQLTRPRRSRETTPAGGAERELALSAD